MATDNSSLTESLTPEESPSPSTTVTVSGTDTSSDTSVSFLKPSRSPVWKYFHRQTQGHQCGNIFVAKLEVHIVCCVTLGGTTSSLIKHLEIKHKSEVEVHGETVAAKDTVLAKQLSIMKFGQLCKGKSVDKPYSVGTQEEITRILTK